MLKPKTLWEGFGYFQEQHKVGEGGEGNLPRRLVSWYTGEVLLLYKIATESPPAKNPEPFNVFVSQICIGSVYGFHVSCSSV